MPPKTSQNAESACPQPSGLPGTDLLFAMGTHTGQIWIELGTEVVRFFCDRLQQDIKAQQAILGCTSFEQLQQIQTEHLTAAQQDYAAEGTRMLMIATGGVPVLGVARRFDDVPL